MHPSDYDVVLRAVLAAMMIIVCLPTQSGAANGRTIWTALDSALYSIVNFFSRRLRALQIDKGRWQSSLAERNFVLRFGMLGLILVFAFPLHRHFGTDAFIDRVWMFGEFAKHISQHVYLFPNTYYSEDYWRDAEFELWEVCVFLWTIVLIGVHQGKEIATYFKTTSSRTTSAFHLGQAHLILVIIFIAFGITSLLVFSFSLYRVVFEFAAMLFLAVSEALLVRAYYKENILRNARNSSEILVYVELPALIAFLAIFVFMLGAGGLSTLPTHWSHPFVAGAAALDLLLANVSLLVIGLVQSLRE